MSKTKKNVLFIGFGLCPVRREAVSLNTSKFASRLLKEKFGVYYFSFSPKISFLKYIINRNKYIKDIANLIEKKKITHIQDTFVLPLASIVFIIPLIRKFKKVIFIKEIHNDHGFSRCLHAETIIRYFANTKRQLEIVLEAFDRKFSRSVFLSKKYHIEYLPPEVKVFPLIEKKSRKKTAFCYLGHPIKKKGLDFLMKAINNTPPRYKGLVTLNFSLSNLGERKKYVNKLKQISQKSGITINIYNEVNPELFFRENDVFILPLLDSYSATSIPNSILEAMEAGCIVCTTQTYFSTSVIKNGWNGLLFERPSVYEIQRIITKILASKIDLLLMARRARADIISHYSGKSLRKPLLHIYE